jgi:purine-cytosine permease-like protein
MSWMLMRIPQPLILVMSLGVAVMCAALAIPAWSDAYASEELGGLVGAALEAHTVNGFAKFLMVVLVLSVVANNIINVYSYAPSSRITHVANVDDVL